jgi:hypothetical protein
MPGRRRKRHSAQTIICRAVPKRASTASASTSTAWLLPAAAAMVLPSCRQRQRVLRRPLPECGDQGRQSGPGPGGGEMGGHGFRCVWVCP